MTAVPGSGLAWVRRIAVFASVISGLLTYVTLALVLNAHHPRVVRAYWVSGDAAWKGLDPFAVYQSTPVFHPRPGVTVLDPNLNPPTMLPLFQLLALVEMHVGAVIWTILSATLFYGACWTLIRRYKPHPVAVPWLLLSPIFADSLILGQTYTLLFALGVGGWLMLDKRRDIAAGIFIGLLCALKPNFGVWPLFLLLSGRWRPAICAGIAGAATIIVSLLLYGFSTYRQWLNAVGKDMHFVIPTDASLNGALLRFGIAHGNVLGLALVLAIGFWCWRKRPVEPSGPALLVAVLASPLAWAHYALLAFPAFLVRRWSPLTIALAALLSVPPAIVASAMVRPDVAWFGLYYPAVLLFTLGALLAVQPVTSRRAPQLPSDPGSGEGIARSD